MANPRNNLASKLHDYFFGDANRITNDFLRHGAYNQHGPYEPDNNGFVTGSSSVGESNNCQFSGEVSGQSWLGSYSSHLADDEAIAKTLQEMEDKLGCMALNDGPSENLTDDSSDSQSYSPRGGRQDDVDIDDMSYEEIDQLGQSMGTVNPGLSLQEISRLPIHKYKPSRRNGKSADNDTECVICKMEYEDGDRMITLPCAHQYHENCITNWFKENRNCCVCKQEIDV